MKRFFVSMLLISFIFSAIGPIPAARAHVEHKGWLCGLKLCLCESKPHNHDHKENQGTKKHQHVHKTHTSNPFFKAAPCHDTKKTFKRTSNGSEYHSCEQFSILSVPTPSITEVLSFLQIPIDLPQSFEKPPQNSLPVSI